MDLRDTSLGFYRAWHAAIGTRHGLFLALRDAPMLPATLSKELGLDASAVARWCEGAWALGLLSRRSEAGYRLAREHRRTLGEPLSPDYLGYHFEYLAQKSLGFAALDDLLRGRPTKADLAETYAIATRWDHQASFDAMDASMRRGLRVGIDVLDLGAGEGGWTREAMRRFPSSRFTASDLDTRPLATLSGARVWDAKRIPPKSFDLVFLGEVLAAASEPAKVLRAAHRALRSGGCLYLLEGLRPPPGRIPAAWGERLVLAMGLDFSLDGSRYLSLAELRRAAREAGFGALRARDLGGSLFAATVRKR